MQSAAQTVKMLENLNAVLNSSNHPHPTQHSYSLPVFVCTFTVRGLGGVSCTNSCSQCLGGLVTYYTVDCSVLG